MERVPKLLLLGSTGNNPMLTEFACAVIKSLSPKLPVIGVKEIMIDSRDEPEGRAASFSGGCTVMEERGLDTNDYPARMLKAGAKKVFTLRVRRESLGKAGSALKELLDPDSVMVCESNSLRLAIDPDLFLILKQKTKNETKPSCREVIALADELFESDNGRFHPAPQSITFAWGHWTWKRQATAIVMAGGDSRRMGRDKSLLPIEGQPMISHIISQLEPSFQNLLVSAARADAFPFLGLEVVPDQAPGAGPLMALVSALEKSKTELNLVVPCDIPDPPQHLIAQLLREARDAEVVVPVTARGELEPLFAVYRKSVLASAREALAQGKRRVISFYPKHTVKKLPLAPETTLLNLNTMEDYLARLKQNFQI